MNVVRQSIYPKNIIYFFIGTTAELIKLAPVIKGLKERNVDFKIITSGQTKVHFNEFSDFLGRVNADIALKEKGNKSSIFIFTLWAIKTFFVGLFLLRKEFKGLNKRNSYFIVHGDTVSSVIGALIASLYGLRVVHIESGLRSFNFLEPFPEELSRFVVSRLADVLFCPNKWAVNNLRGVRGVKIDTKQNTLIESFWWALRRSKKSKFRKTVRGNYFVLVIHRQEHVVFRKRWSKEILEFILKNKSNYLKCIVITHEITKSLLNSISLTETVRKSLALMSRLPYTEFIGLLEESEFIITDGGSNQEEMYYMGKPCLLIRNCTERIEGLNKNVILSKDKSQVIVDFFKNYKKYKKKKIFSSESPSKIIVDYLVNF